MSEFSEVIRNMARMCDSHGVFCEKCDLDNSIYCELARIAGSRLEFGDMDKEKLSELEKIVNTWSKNHPEPIYPTWLEWLVEQKVLQSNLPVYNLTTCAYYAGPKISTRIPEEMEKKLDIKPVNLKKLS